MPLLIHLAETQDEVKQIADAHHHVADRSISSRSASGRDASVAAHAVWLDDADMTTLAARGVGVVHNPESNMKLASGIAAVPKWLAHGHPRRPRHRRRREQQRPRHVRGRCALAALLQKVATMDPQALPAREALSTGDAPRRGRARAWARSIGSLEAGKQADVITVTMDGARQTPMYDAISHLVYVSRGDDVRNTIVAGRVLMRDRQVLTLNATDVLRDARAMAVRVREAVTPARPAKEQP